jgi:hypothetical protein
VAQRMGQTAAEATAAVVGPGGQKGAKVAGPGDADFKSDEEASDDDEATLEEEERLAAEVSLLLGWGAAAGGGHGLFGGGKVLVFGQESSQAQRHPITKPPG